MRDIEKPMERPPLNIILETEKKDESSIVLKKLVFGYTEKENGDKVFRGGPISLKLPLGSRIAILGNNGVGKSTLLKTITGDLAPVSGKVTWRR
jgi:ATPase subunit of ABC transporter with duplicated ATPase domains